MIKFNLDPTRKQRSLIAVILFGLGVGLVCGSIFGFVTGIGSWFLGTAVVLAVYNDTTKD